MKKVLFILAVSFAFVACQSSQKKTEENKSEAIETTVPPVEATLKVEGMTCTGCEETIATLRPIRHRSLTIAAQPQTTESETNTPSESPNDLIPPSPGV